MCTSKNVEFLCLTSTSKCSFTIVNSAFWVSSALKFFIFKSALMFKTNFSVFLLFLFLSFSGFSQSYRFKVYDSEKDGIFPYIYSIHQDTTGFLWIGTGEGLFRFDGHLFKSFDLSKISGDNFISAGITDKKGKNWFGHNNGKISVYDGQKFENIVLPVENPGVITSLISGNNGELWVSTQNSGICKIDETGKVQHYSKAFAGQQVYCIYLRKNDLLVGTGNGLFIFNPAAPDVLSEIPKTPLTKIECINFSKSTGNYYFGTEDAGIFSLKGLIIKEIFSELNLSEVPVKDIVCEADGSLWIGTMGKGLFNIPYSQNFNSFQTPVNFNQTNGLNSQNIKKLFFDLEGNIWIGTYGNGLITFLENFFTFILQDERTGASIFAVYPGKDCIWAGSKGKLIKIFPDLIQTPVYFSNKEGIPNDKITSIYLDKDFILWIGTEKNGLYTFDPKKGKAQPYFISEDQLENSISSIDGFGNNIFAGSHNGLIIINKDKKTHQILTTSNGLPHNFINHIITDVNSNVWIATPTNYLGCYNKGGFKKIKISSTDDLLKVNSLAFDIRGCLWLATYGNGVYMKTDSAFLNFLSANGLLSDYCYSIISDETGTIWVGHRQGLSSIYQNTIKQFGKNRGVINDCNINACCVDKSGIIWTGTTNGILRYDFRKNSINRIPPEIIITSIKFNDTDIQPSDKISMPYGKYKVKIDFVGITFRNPELVTYKYMLDGYYQDWSELTFNTFAVFPRLSDGNYTLLIKAFNADGISTAEPFKLTINIEAPFWKKWWFILICIVILVYGFYLFIKIRERNHRKLEEMLQKTIDERTSEVVAQKELIEQKNQDITDSINYAKRIQEAILPSPSKLSSVFPNSFIYYLPRDIVSGDFYVFYQTENEEKFILICADATGHGVPGAFMSLICSTILKDILRKKQIISPSQVLYELDKELKISLQSEENNKTTDGLDAAVCEFDIKTNELIFASAMRPLLIFRANGLEYIRGSRFSIGASQFFVNKKFTEHHFTLNDGDCIYLFSDGFADQFGGKNNKKLKIRGLQKWIIAIHSLNMNEQYKKLQKMFNEWKGSHQQIDDVLIMGIKYRKTEYTEDK
ncbi:MAG: hypothetical protein COX07_00620 [Bacteroidetes bacterium CG23_combo_of_CG06-09_8_20_14_all_32_9]|nr:MAG: hypothetical protein COX07_00620 [Bacteroidetes bacterium CG23_combo_of_CG06-09_8_20_14_all_32_9]